MRASDALRALTDVTAYQWGMVTSAQASLLGITRLDLSRLAAAGHLERVAHGVYKDAGAPGRAHDDLKAAWLSTDAKAMGVTRIKDAANGVVVAAESAADLHGIGDFRARRHEFVSPGRRQSQRSGIRYRQRALDPGDVTLVDGLPVMTMERTIADLIDEVGDLSLVADALRDASRQRNLDLERLHSLLAPLAQRHGFRKGNGADLLARLMEIAGIDLAAVARRVAADASLGSKVAANYLAGLSKEDIDRFLRTPEMQPAIRSIHESLAATFRHSMAPQVANIAGAMEPHSTDLIKNSGLDEVAREVSAELVNSDVMKKIFQGWATALKGSALLNPETLTAFREAHQVIARG